MFQVFFFFVYFLDVSYVLRCDMMIWGLFVLMFFDIILIFDFN